jgi:hypothetical protein
MPLRRASFGWVKEPLLLTLLLGSEGLRPEDRPLSISDRCYLTSQAKQSLVCAHSVGISAAYWLIFP